MPANKLSPAAQRLVTLMDCGRRPLTRVWVRERNRYEYCIGDQVLVGIGRTVIAMEARGQLVRKPYVDEWQLPDPF